MTCDLDALCKIFLQELDDWCNLFFVIFFSSVLSKSDLLTCDNFETRSREFSHSTFDRSTNLSGSLVNKENFQCQQDLSLKCSAWKDLVPSPKIPVLRDPLYQTIVFEATVPRTIRKVCGVGWIGGRDTD